jgi:hypothetical protein
MDRITSHGGRTVTVHDRAGTPVEDRLRRLEDLEAIHRLFLDYGTYLDAKDFVACSQLWAATGEFVAPFESVRGPEGVLRLLTGMVGEHLALETGQEFHVFTNPTIELDGDRATATSMWLYITPDDEGHPRIAQFGHYEDVLVREEGRWKFERRNALRDLGVPGGGVPGRADR